MERILKAISSGRLVVALLLAVVVWGYVITTQYPEDSIPIPNVPVQSSGLSSNLVARQITPQTVKVTISGAKDKINLVPLSAIQPAIDLTNCNKPGTCDVKVTLRQPPENVTGYAIDPDTIQVQLEEIIAKEFDIEVNKVGAVRLGYQQEQITLNNSKVVVTGPNSIVSRIAKAQVTVNLEDRDTNLQGSVPVTLFDANSQNLTEKEKGLTLTPAMVSVNVPVNFKLNTKTVPIRVLTTGQPAFGYIAGSSITTEPTVVTINGDPRVLQPISYLETKPLDLTNATSDIESTTELVGLNNIAIIGSTLVKVRIGITVAQASVPLDIRYEVINQPPVNLKYEIRPGPTVNITLQGPYQLLQPKLPLDQIKATVDLAGYNREGTFDVTLQVQTPAGLVATNLPKMTVILLAAPRPTAVPVPPTPTVVSPPTAVPAPVPTTSVAAGTTGISAPTPAVNPSVSPATGSVAPTPRPSGNGVTPATPSPLAPKQSLPREEIS